MYNLIRKDLILNKKILLVVAPLYVLYMTYLGSRISGPRMVIIFGTFLCSIISLIFYTREDKFKAAVLACSLPATRAQIVRARYVLSWVLTLAVYVLMALAIAAFPGGKIKFEALFSPKMILMALAFITIYLAVLLPLLLRFGLVAFFIFLIGLQVLGVVFMFLAVQKLYRFNLRALIDGVNSGLLSLQAHLGVPAAYAVLLAVLILLNAASFNLAVFLFKRKDL